MVDGLSRPSSEREKVNDIFPFFLSLAAHARNFDFRRTYPPSFVEAFGIPASKISQPLYFGAVISLDVQPLATGADLHS